MSRSISDWLRTNGLEEYIPVFLENQVDLKTLAVLTEPDLKELGIPFGPRKRILNALSDTRNRAATGSLTRTPWSESSRTAAQSGERRQVAVLFCDIVGFTELTGRLDPELLQSLIRTYEDACTGCINRYGGYVFQRLGDGIVGFFGVPLAQEGGAERAIRTGILIVETLAQLAVPEVGRLRVRIGIASGVVVVSLSENSAVGDTMNLAARLQSLAQPGSIVVSDQVREMAGGTFNFLDLGEKSLKGIARPARVYQVINTSAVASRFDAAAGEHLTPLVGRDDEVNVLLECWRLARNGRGQAAVISGEPGIGKSRIVSSLRAQLAVEGAVPVLFQCSPYHTNSAFYPISDYLERRLELRHDELPAGKLDRLEALMMGRYGRPIEDVHLIALMLSIPCQERYGGLAITPKLQKEKTVRALVDLAEATAYVQPSLLLFEDLHWADPTTLEVLDHIIDRARNVALLVVGTHRPEFPARWRGRPHLTEIALGRLTREQSQKLVARLSAANTLPEDLVEQIVGKTDGVPLFVEELTRSILELGAWKDEGGHYTYAIASSDAAIPATLRDLLTARLDRVKEIKEIAQVGATIGRDFSYELISAVASMAPEALDAGLARLAEAGLVYQRGKIPHATYSFKHALVQEAAYDSLLKSRRREFHGVIARVLEERFPGTKDTEPELLAQHYTEGGLAEAAVPFWRKAGELAMRRFSLPEAVSHLQKGLAMVKTLPAGRERDQRELDLRCLLGPALLARRSWAAPEVGEVLEPALTLAKSLQHEKSYLPILHGLWVNALTSARLAHSKNWATEMLTTAAATKNADLDICGHRAAMTSYYWLGDLVAARMHGDIIRSVYSAERHWHIAVVTNSDPLTGDGIYRGQYLWMLGYPDQARALTAANLKHARERNHPFDLAFALTLGAQVFEFRGEPEQLLRHAAEGERVGREHGVPVMSEVLAEISKGIGWLGVGRVMDSIGQLREAIERLNQTGQLLWTPYLRARLAEALARSGDPQDGLALIEQSLTQIEIQSERSHLAEVLRLKGCLLRQLGRTDEAVEALHAAVAFAQKQQTKSWELRAATTLADLLTERGDRKLAHELLAPVYRWFTEGFDTKDLKDAKALLDRL